MFEKALKLQQVAIFSSGQVHTKQSLWVFAITETSKYAFNKFELNSNCTLWMDFSFLVLKVLLVVIKCILLFSNFIFIFTAVIFRSRSNSNQKIFVFWISYVLTFRHYISPLQYQKFITAPLLPQIYAAFKELFVELYRKTQLRWSDMQKE